MTDRKKPGAAFWVTVAVVSVMFYAASFGPAIWIVMQPQTPKWICAGYRVVYAPTIWFTNRGAPGNWLMRQYVAF